MLPVIKLFSNIKILGKFVSQIVPPIDSILLEDESGSMVQEMDGQIALELQEN
jgi:hypothetical protein